MSCVSSATPSRDRRRFRNSRLFENGVNVAFYCACDARRMCSCLLVDKLQCRVVTAVCQHVSKTAVPKCWLAQDFTASTELTNSSKWQGYHLSVCLSVSHTYLCSNSNNSRNKFLPYLLSSCKFCANQQVVKMINSHQTISYPVLHDLWNVSLWFVWSHNQVAIWRRVHGAGDGQARHLLLRFVGNKCGVICFVNLLAPEFYI
jgi:hypothetical protein